MIKKNYDEPYWSLVQQIDSMKISLAEIFVQTPNKTTYSKEELWVLDIKKDFIERLENYYGLVHIQDSSEDKNVCYADSSAIRFEYKWMFTKKDVIAYLLHQLKQDSFQMEADEVIFSKSHWFMSDLTLIRKLNLNWTNSKNSPLCTQRYRTKALLMIQRRLSSCMNTLRLREPITADIM